MSRPAIPSERLDPSFAPHLGPFDLTHLERRVDVVYGLHPDLQLAYVNEAWRRFAVANDGPSVPERWPLGRSIAEAWPEPLRAFHRDGFEGCLRSGEAWIHDYECSTPDVRRLFSQTVYPLAQQGFLVVHALRDERPLDSPDHAPDRARFESPDGVITMCSHCRSVRDRNGRWLRVSAWVRRMPPTVSHGLCEPCFAWFYGAG